jgi:hypothetical protein
MLHLSALVLAAALCISPSLSLADWLLDATPPAVTLTPWSLGGLSGQRLSNGLLALDFLTSVPGTLALWDFKTLLDQPSGESLLRAFSPEAALTCVGCAGGARPLQPPPFVLLATDAAATEGDCPFVAQGNASSLASCQASCWAAPTCTTVNWAYSANPDCVLRACASPLSPALSPYAGFRVYSALLPSTSASLGGVVAAPALGRSLATGPYLNRTGLDAPGALQSDPASPFAFLGLAQAPMDKPFEWAPGTRGADPAIPWPHPGLHAVATFQGMAATAWENVTAAVHYQLLQGLPFVGRWVEVGCSEGLQCGIVLDAVECVILALNPGFSPIASAPYPGQSEDFAGGMPLFPGTGRLTAVTSLQYGAHARHSNDVLSMGGDAGSTQPRLSIGDDEGLNFPLGTSGPWTSVKAYLLLHDEGWEQGGTVPLYPSSETYWGCTLGPCAVPGSGTPFEGSFSERRGLALRRFLLAVAPQVAEAPLQYHLVASDSASVRAACDQMSSVGWEMLVESYGSGYDVESSDPAYLARVAGDVAYCKARGVEVGGYDLIGWTRDPGRGWGALDAAGHDTGNACFGSGWEDFFQGSVLNFSVATGASVIETDGESEGSAGA